MKTTIAPLLLFTLLAPLNAEEDKMKFDKLLDYTNVTVTKIEPDGIRIIHESGAAKIAYENVPEEVRAKLGMNQEAAEAHREKVQIQQQQIAEANKKQQVLAKARLTFVGSIFQVTDGGLLLRDVSYTDGTKEETKIPYKVQSGGPSGLHPNAPVTYTTHYNSEWVLKVRSMSSWPIFVECDTSGYADGDQFSGNVYANGTFAYTNTQGARKTIPAYTTDASKVLERAGLGDKSEESPK
jgi:hypothetical protein